MQRDSQQFGAFRIVRRLGVGGMAETFVAERRGPVGFEQRLCLKRVLPAFCEDEAFVAMFQNEARLAARLSHPHIAQVYDFGEVDGQWWMTLELIDGIDLRALLDAVRKLGQPMPLDLVLLIVADVCAALTYAHEPPLDGRQSIVHRDVSPSNVLLSYDGAVKLADFGIAKPASGDRATASGVKGKVPYMSPEQALGGAVDGRSDLFSLGVMAFEMLADRRPFDGPTDLATLANLVAGKRSSLADLAPHAPAPLVALIERLIQPDRDARPATGGDVLDALSSTSPPLNSRRVLGQLVRRIRPPEAPPLPVDPTGPTVATPSPPAPAQKVQPAASATEEISATPAADEPPSTADDTHAPEVHESPRGPVTAPAASPEPKRSGRPLAFAAGSVALLVVLGVSAAAVSFRDRSPSPSAEPAPSPSPWRPPPPTTEPVVQRVAPLPTAPAVEPPLDAGTIPVAEGPADVAARGTLVITAYPWGFVEVDGRPLGRSPVRVDLPAGDHNVLVRADAITKRRVVTVTAGRRREVVVPVE